MTRPSQNGMEHCFEVRLRPPGRAGTDYLVDLRWPLADRHEGPFSLKFATPEEAVAFLSRGAYLNCGEEDLFRDPCQWIVEAVGQGRAFTSTANPALWLEVVEDLRNEAIAHPLPGPADGVFGLGCLDTPDGLIPILGLTVRAEEDGLACAWVRHLAGGLEPIALVAAGAWQVTFDGALQFLANNQIHTARRFQPSDASWLLNGDVDVPREVLESSVLMSAWQCQESWDPDDDSEWDYEPSDLLWALVDPVTLTVFALLLTFDDEVIEEWDSYFRAHGAWFHDGPIGEPRWDAVVGDQYYEEIDALPGFVVEAKWNRAADLVALFDEGTPIGLLELEPFASDRHLGPDGRYGVELLRRALEAQAAVRQHDS